MMADGRAWEARVHALAEELRSRIAALEENTRVPVHEWTAHYEVSRPLLHDALVVLAGRDPLVYWRPRPGRGWYTWPSRTSLVAKIATTLEREIDSGLRRPGDKVIVRELAAEFEVGTARVSDAVGLLAARGRVRRRERGSPAVVTFGTFDWQPVCRQHAIADAVAAGISAADFIDLIRRAEAVEDGIARLDPASLHAYPDEGRFVLFLVRYSSRRALLLGAGDRAGARDPERSSRRRAEGLTRRLSQVSDDRPWQDRLNELVPLARRSVVWGEAPAQRIDERELVRRDWRDGRLEIDGLAVVRDFTVIALPDLRLLVITGLPGDKGALRAAYEVRALADFLRRTVAPA